MEATDVPEPRTPASDKQDVPPSPPSKRTPILERALQILQVDPVEFEQLRNQVNDLETQVMESKEAIEERLVRLGTQVYEDGIAVFDLRTQLAASKKPSGEDGSPGKRSYKKIKARTPGHRYPTRYSESLDDEPLKISKREFAGVERKITMLEGNVDKMKGEQKKLKEDLTAAKELSNKVGILDSALDSFKTAQVRLSMTAFTELGQVRKLCTDSLIPQLQSHARLLADLQHRYNSLALTANALLLQQQAKRPTPRPPMTMLPPPLPSQTVPGKIYSPPPRPTNIPSSACIRPTQNIQLPSLRSILTAP